MKRVFTSLAASLCVLAMVAQNNVEQVDSVNAELDSIMKRWEITLGEVVVKSTLPKTQVKGDALRTTVAGSILEKAGTTTDVLNKLPMLKATKGSGVEVTGRGAAEVYINGRKVQDMNELDRIQADQIQSVDVIQNPGARYAAATKAVVRIQLKKAKGEGISVVDYVDAWYKYKGTLTNNLDVNYRTGGLDITASLWAGTYGGRSLQENILTYKNDSYLYSGVCNQDTHERWNGYSPQLQFNYTINDKHSFGAFYKWDHNLKNHGEGDLVTDIFENDRQFERSESHIMVDRGSHKHILSGYYNGRVKNLSIDFNFDALFNKSDEDNTTDENLISTDTGTATHYNIVNNTKSTNNFWAGKLVFSYPLLQGNLSVGTEYSYNRRTDTYSYVSSDVIPVKASDNLIKENMCSGFVEYGRRFGRVFVQAGLRYEHLGNDYYNFGVKEEDVCRSYGDFFPTLALSMPVGKTQMSLSYRKDINRPSYHDLTNSIISTTHYTYQCGNPYLTPNYVHNIALNVGYKWMNFNAQYSRDIDYMTFVTEQFPGSEDHTISIVHTINSEHPFNRFVLSAYARPVIGKWHPTWSASVCFQDYKTLDLDGNESTLNHPCGKFRWDNDIELPHGFIVNACGDFITRGDYGSYRVTKAAFVLTLGAKRDFSLKNNMGVISVGVKVNDILSTGKSDAVTMGVRHMTLTNPAKPTYSMSVVWKFNEADKKYKGTGAGNSQKQRM